MKIRKLLSISPIVWLLLIALGFITLSIEAARYGETDEDDIFNVWGRDSHQEAAKQVSAENEAFRKAAQKSAQGVVEGINKTIQKISNASDICLRLRTSVPSSQPIYDELQYLTERGGDRVLPYEVNRSLSYLLFHSEQPSLTGLQNPHVKYTKGPSQIVGLPMSRELKLAQKVAASKGNLLPEDIVRMSLEVTDGDYPAAMLTAHNFLKEITYGERHGGFPPTYMVMPAPSSKSASKALENKLQNRLGSNFEVRTQNYGSGDIQIEVRHSKKSLGNKLRNLRVSGDKYPSDKMGPWYHMFGVLYLSSVAKGGRYTAETWAKVEGLARKVPFFPSPPDYFKTTLTDMTGEQAGTVLDLIDKESNLKKCEKIPKNIKEIQRLNHTKLLAVFNTLKVKSPEPFFNCLCRNAGYGSSTTSQYYHPDTIGEFNPRYSCNQPGEPCIVEGWGCSRHPLPSNPKVWESCIKSNKINTKKTADGKVDPNSGVPLDEYIEQALRQRKTR